MGLKLITAPAATPITLAEAKEHLRVTTSSQDAYITTCLKAATTYTEEWLGRALVDQTWELVLDGFPTGTSFLTTGEIDTVRAIQIPKPPLISIVQIAYDDSNGDEQIMNANNYYADTASEPGWVVLNGITQWPTTIAAINSVRIRFRAGYESMDSPVDTAIPDDILAAVKLTMESLFENRGRQIVGEVANAMPFGVDALLIKHRVTLGMA